MHRIDTPTAQADKFGPGKNGFTNGDPATGRRATDLNSDMWDAVQEEICAVIEKSGLTLNKEQHDQLYQAIEKIITGKIPDALLKKNNLSDLTDKVLARANLQLKSAATVDTQSSGTDDTSGRALLVGAGGLLSRPIVQGVDTGNPATWPTQNSTRFLTYSPANGDPARASIFLKDTIGNKLVEFLAPYSGNDGKLLQVRNSSAVFTLYSDRNKPTAGDVGAYPSTGGTLNGNLSTTGTISENGQRVYSPNNKPTAGDVGAYPSTGGTLNGNLSTTGTISENGQRVYSPNNKPSTASLAINGWEKDLVTGIITQWGKGRYNDGQAVNFPIAFPNAVFSVVISSNPTDNVNLTETTQAYPVSNTQFLTGCATFSGGSFVPSSLNCTWIAKGY